MTGRTILVWFRNDLRIHDNEVLLRAIEQGGNVIPVYCFDPRLFGEGPFGTKKTGVIRASFIIENVKALRESLKHLGSTLITACGKPEDLLPELTRRYGVDEVYHHREVAYEETQVSTWVEEALWRQQLNLKHFIGHTLYHKEDLPFPIKDIPDAFATFKRKAERESSIRPTLPSPEHVPSPPNLEETEIPTLEQLRYTPEEIALVPNLEFKGGEQIALKIMDEFLNHPDGKQAYNLSPYIAIGALSPNLFFHEIKAAETRIGKKETESNVLKLMWRDYYRFMFKKHGNRFFQLYGMAGSLPYAAKEDQTLFDRWKSGNTGQSLIDYGMNQLNTSGFIPDELRIVLAAYLVQELQVSWLMGAAWFEEKLVDYNPASNYGNWAHIAGVGSSQRENKPVDIQRLIQRLELSFPSVAE